MLLITKTTYSPSFAYTALNSLFHTIPTKPQPKITVKSKSTPQITMSSSFQAQFEAVETALKDMDPPKQVRDTTADETVDTKFLEILHERSATMMKKVEEKERKEKEEKEKEKRGRERERREGRK
ncbi:hypothetical protein EG329_007159 [Mollisiaceae sp. DMI_Dod_QoI]|nr:hypothetical protein EG329_007159 [Helotiales sp. DMI_Dod_QoI]